MSARVGGERTTMTPDPDWHRRAACKDMDQAPFFDNNYDEAKAICQPCPVKRDCYEYAVERRIEYGCWGGLTPRERGVANGEVEYLTLVCKACEKPFRWANVRGFNAPKACSSSCRRKLQYQAGIRRRKAG